MKILLKVKIFHLYFKKSLPRPRFIEKKNAEKVRAYFCSIHFSGVDLRQTL